MKLSKNDLMDLHLLVSSVDKNKLAVGDKKLYLYWKEKLFNGAYLKGAEKRGGKN